MDVREKLVELANDVLRCLPWGEIQKDTAEQIADRMMDHGVTVQEWISVEDRLPDSGKYVLLYCSDGLYGEGHYRAYENKWYLSKITYKSIPDVTHWMPLPKPPKGE